MSKKQEMRRYLTFAGTEYDEVNRRVTKMKENIRNAFGEADVRVGWRVHESCEGQNISELGEGVTKAIFGQSGDDYVAVLESFQANRPFQQMQAPVIRATLHFNYSVTAKQKKEIQAKQEVPLFYSKEGVLLDGDGTNVESALEDLKSNEESLEQLLGKEGCIAPGRTIKEYACLAIWSDGAYISVAGTKHEPLLEAVKRFSPFELTGAEITYTVSAEYSVSPEDLEKAKAKVAKTLPKPTTGAPADTGYLTYHNVGGSSFIC